MNEKDQYKNRIERIELLQGILDMLILQTLQRGTQHGYGIVQALRLRFGDVLQVETGSLYPALALEMVIERSFGHVGGIQNRIDAGTLESRSVDLLKTRFQQAFPRALWITGPSLLWIT